MIDYNFFTIDVCGEREKKYIEIGKIKNFLLDLSFSGMWFSYGVFFTFLTLKESYLVELIKSN